MRHSSLKIIIFLQIFLYLLGGHATAHGLAWCLSADGHAHVATAAGCIPGQEELSCPSASSCHSGVDCRHVPVTFPHATGVAPAHQVQSGSVVAIIPTVSDSTLRCLAVAVCRQTLFPPSLELPRPVALLSLRTIVLVI